MAEVSLARECPAPDEILEWVAGHHDGTARGTAISVHVASCPECTEYVKVSCVVMAAVTEDLPRPPRAAPDRPSLEEMASRMRALESDAESIFAGDPSEWSTRLSRHRSLSDPDFLYFVADRAVYFADEKPEAIADLLEALREAIAASSPRDAGATLALLELARGIVLQTQGDQPAAIERFIRGERALPYPGQEPEYPRLLLAKVVSLRRLKRYDEAREAAGIAMRQFEATGTIGKEKALWALANIAAETGDARDAYRKAVAAHRILVERGDLADATAVLLTVVLTLRAMRRFGPAGRLLDRLSERPEIHDNPSMHARLLWNKAKLAVEREDAGSAIALLDKTVDLFASAGVLLDAAEASLDLAMVYGKEQRVDEQLGAASRAAALLKAIPGQEAQWAAAVLELEEALRAPLMLSSAIRSAQSRIQKSPRQ